MSNNHRVHNIIVKSASDSNVVQMQTLYKSFILAKETASFIAEYRDKSHLSERLLAFK